MAFHCRGWLRSRYSHTRPGLAGRRRQAYGSQRLAAAEHLLRVMRWVYELEGARAWLHPWIAAGGRLAVYSDTSWADQIQSETDRR